MLRVSGFPGRRQALTPEMATQWAELAHVCYLEALMSQSDWTAGDIAFHGGTSLRLSWSSARYSEDLDFLLSRRVADLAAVSARVERQIGEMLRSIDPLFEVQVRDKTKDPDRMPAYMISVSHPLYVGNAKIKAEFWRADPEYLRDYPTQLRTPKARLDAPAPSPSSSSSTSPAAPARTRGGAPLPDGLMTKLAQLQSDLMLSISNPVPAATLETAYADKLVALATRPHLKWRDLYDLWWIGTQTSAQLDIDAVSEQFLANIRAYTPAQGLPPAQALELFLQRPAEDIERQADPDLRNWLPPRMWQRLQGDGVRQIVSYVQHAVHTVSQHLQEQPEEQPERPAPSMIDLKRVPDRPFMPKTPAPRQEPASEGMAASDEAYAGHSADDGSPQRPRQRG